jgi:hypothetical protein
MPQTPYLHPNQSPEARAILVEGEKLTQTHTTYVLTFVIILSRNAKGEE